MDRSKKKIESVESKTSLENVGKDLDRSIKLCNFFVKIFWYAFSRGFEPGKGTQTTGRHRNVFLLKP